MTHQSEPCPDACRGNYPPHASRQRNGHFLYNLLIKNRLHCFHLDFQVCVRLMTIFVEVSLRPVVQLADLVSPPLCLFSGRLQAQKLQLMQPRYRPWGLHQLDFICHQSLSRTGLKERSNFPIGFERELKGPNLWKCDLFRPSFL